MNAALSDPIASRRDVVLITGASTGLGLALAQRLIAEDEYHLILTARERSLDRFEAVGIQEGPSIWLRPLDVTDANQRDRVVEEAEARLGHVDILVNNAGIAYRSVLEHVGEVDWLEQMRVNFYGPTELTRRVLPTMRRRHRGRIIALSSVGGMMAMPTMALYSASKFALEGAFEALWYEVRPWGIHVTLVQPGFVRSDSFRNTRYTEQAILGRDRSDHPYHAHYRHMTGFISRWMEKAWSRPDDIARVIVRVMRRRDPPLRVSATPDARLFALLRRLLPRRIYHRLLYACLPGIQRWNGVQDPVLNADIQVTAPAGEAESSAPARK